MAEQQPQQQQQQKKPTPMEALDEFYRLKGVYENGYFDKYVKKIVRNQETSKREKKRELAKLPPKKCVNCKRPVGTLFSITYKEEDNTKTYRAKCGDLQDPCPLDIAFRLSSVDLLETLIHNGMKSIDRLKTDIIQEKNNALFFAKTGMEERFDDLVSQLKANTEDTGFYIETNLVRNNNPEKRQLIQKKVDLFGKEFVLPFRQMVTEYLETGSETVLTRAIEFYLHEIVPFLKELQSLKYEVSVVDYDEATNTYQLIQQATSLENKLIQGKDVVLKFVKGVRQQKRKQTQKERAEITVTKKNKTLKKRPPVLLLVEDDDEDEDEDEDKKARIIEAIPPKWKEHLEKDPEWLEAYVNECIRTGTSGIYCKLILPPSTKIPPLGGYDFQSEFINNMFAKLSPQQQQLLLGDGTDVENITSQLLDYINNKYTKFG